MPARRWILVPAPRDASIAPILAAIAILVGLGLVASALALAPGQSPVPAARTLHSVIPAAGSPRRPSEPAAPPRKAPANAGRWM